MLSVVIPTLNAAEALPACLARMQAADEILVVDGGSRDDSRAIAEAAGARVIVSPPGRGMQLKAGGEAARGRWLLFLHADTIPAPGWAEAVAAHSRAHRQAAACFAFRLSARAWQARLVEQGVAARVRWLSLPYGDQGLLVPRALYDRVGGYRPLPLMEDVDLVRRLGRVRVLDAEAWTSARRWLDEGWVRRSARNLFCLGLYGAGVTPERIARLYG